MDNMLTIAIPTYNRNPLLIANLRRLIPQLDEKCRLLIIDDHSPTPVSQALESELSACKANITVRRNTSNIGLSANVMRCFETCDTEWMWLLGDDDAVEHNAISVIRTEIQKHSDSVFINFCPPNDTTRRKSFETTGCLMLIDRLDNFSHLLFMSYGVYRAPFFKKHLRFGYHFAYSFAVHVVLILSALDEHSTCTFSSEAVCSQGSESCKDIMPEYKMWNWLTLGMGIPIVFELPLGAASRKILARKYYDSIPVMGNCVWQLIDMGAAGETDTLYYFDQLCKRNSPFFRLHPTRLLKKFAWRFMIQFPHLGRHLAMRFIHMKTGQTMTGHGIAGRFERL